MNEITYLEWQDESKQPSAEKLTAAIDAYTERFKRAPNVANVSSADAALDVPEMKIRVRSYIRPNIYQIGYEESV